MKRSIWQKALARAHAKAVMGRRSRSIAIAFSSIIPANARVLDVGTGNGNLAANIISLRPDVRIEGLDVLVWPEQKIRTHTFDGVNIPMIDGSWEYCMASDVLHHCADPMRLLSEMSRVASEGILIKDHIAKNSFDKYVLGFMDWFGNKGHGVGLEYNYWSREEWGRAFIELDLQMLESNFSLHLYPPPFSFLFDRDLHFVCKAKPN